MSDSGYVPGPGGIAEFDQLLAEAIKKMQEADSFVVVVATQPTPAGPSHELLGMDVSVLSATQTPFAPMFLALAAHLVSRLPLEAMDDLLDTIDDTPPA